MPRITVLDVGDGACAILRDYWPGPGEVAVVDCGVYRGSSDDAAEKLKTALGEQLALVGSIVVTHFDSDHWSGFRALAGKISRGDLPDRVELVYPRAPDRSLDPGVLRLALEATLTGTGVRALDLRLALAAVTNPVSHPVSAGDWFHAAGRRWDVLWPPERVSAQLRNGLIKVVDDMEKLADDMAADGFPELRANIDLAREVAFTQEGDTCPSSDESDGEDDDLPVDEYEGEDEGPAIHGEPHDLERIPGRFYDRFNKASRAVAAANNDLSLVFHDPDRSLIVFGDIGGRALASVVAKTCDSYLVVLPPHHGTRKVPRGFPYGCACISQAGAHHLPRWHRHVDTHAQLGRCQTTARIGTVSFW